MTVSPSLLASLLDTHAIGADGPNGSGSIQDRSMDSDYSEVHIVGVYDLSEVARELSDIDPPRPASNLIPLLWSVIVALLVVIAYMGLR